MLVTMEKGPHKTTREIIQSGTREEMIERLQEYRKSTMRLERALHEAIKLLEKVKDSRHGE